jgi:hypothetical protein
VVTGTTRAPRHSLDAGDVGRASQRSMVGGSMVGGSMVGGSMVRGSMVGGSMVGGSMVAV